MSEISKEVDPLDAQSQSRKSSQSSSTAESFEKIDRGKETETEGEEDASEGDREAEQENEQRMEVEEDRQEKEQVDDVPKDPLYEDPHAHDQLKEDQKQFYTSEDARNAWSNLIMFSSAMLVLPLLTMFTLYHWVFIDHYHMPEDQAMFYAGMCGVAVVFIICGLFVWTAYNEEKEAERRLKLEKKDE
ncbi:hypothetical protein WR25_22450 [Diploscapter pachys]|uniref:Vacuolar ATPase assembly integral membrane protein VMA21 homolog n=1 Tax=Diploscapter pachys TaxID=2018661 RepID=A0A2A2KDI2_9BILA|nr:hypothetical protein WR25_22450 [Diploscapter pachys]